MTCVIGLAEVRYNTISTTSQITIHYTLVVTFQCDNNTDCEYNTTSKCTIIQYNNSPDMTHRGRIESIIHIIMSKHIDIS